MLLKRHYRKEASGVLCEPPLLDYVEVKHTGHSPAQHFSDGLVAAGLAEGWMSIKNGVLTLHAQPEDLHYQILRVPGKYPCATERAGYEVIHYYDCVLEAEQHARHRAGKGRV